MLAQSSTVKNNNDNAISTVNEEFSNEKIAEQLEQIISWLNEHPEINAWKNLENLLLFLRCCKYDVERTKTKITLFYQMRALRIEWFFKRDPFLPEIQELLNIGVLLPIDGVDEENRKVVIIRTAAHDPKYHSLNNFLKVSKMVLDLLLKFEPDNCMNGIAAIFDMRGVTLGHAMQLSPKIIKRSVESWQAYPCQPKLMEFINAPSHVNIFLNTFRIFMTPKMRSRVYVQKQNTTVKCINLPKELKKDGEGTTYKSLTNKWKQLVEANAAFFADNEKYKSILNTN